MHFDTCRRFRTSNYALRPKLHFDPFPSIHLEGKVSKWMISRSAISMWNKSIEVQVLKKWGFCRSEWIDVKFLYRSEKIDMKLWVEVKWSKLTFWSMWISRSEKSIEVNRSKVKRIEEVCIEVKRSNWLLYRSESIEHDIESKCMNRRWFSVTLQ